MSHCYVDNNIRILKTNGKNGKTQFTLSASSTATVTHAHRTGEQWRECYSTVEFIYYLFINLCVSS